jgi:hypothetical protein
MLYGIGARLVDVLKGIERYVRQGRFVRAIRPSCTTHSSSAIEDTASITSSDGSSRNNLSSIEPTINFLLTQLSRKLG